MALKFFIVSTAGYILPIQYHDYESACAQCDSNEMVFMAESLEELEYCIKEWESENESEELRQGEA